MSHSASPIRLIPVGSPTRDHEDIDAQLRRLARARWLFNEYGAQRLRHQVMDLLGGLLDELLDERLIVSSQS